MPMKEIEELAARVTALEQQLSKPIGTVASSVDYSSIVSAQLGKAFDALAVADVPMIVDGESLAVAQRISMLADERDRLKAALAHVQVELADKRAKQPPHDYDLLKQENERLKKEAAIVEKLREAMEGSPIHNIDETAQIVTVKGADVCDILRGVRDG